MEHMPPSARITAIDTLRGFALLGILTMNIASFSMPEAAYFNPMAYGGTDVLNLAVHGAQAIMADQKFMALFSMLFGAGLVLLVDKLESTGRSPLKIHYSRNIWLLVFGIGHAMLWEGDVLMVYALCAFVLYLFRKLEAKTQIIAGVVMYLVPVLASLVFANSLLGAADLNDFFYPTQQQLEAEIAAFQQGLDQDAYMPEFTEPVLLAITLLLIEAFLRAFGMMMIGMGLFRLGVLTAQASPAFYRNMVIYGFGIGVPLAALGLAYNYSQGWRADFLVIYGRLPNHFAALFLAAGYIGLIMGWTTTNVLRPLQSALASVGQMALTNYIGQTLIATSLFYWYGLGLFGTMDRISQMSVVAGIWTFQIGLSVLWLKAFKYGPLEWLWRSLTYMRIQPLLRPRPA